MSQSQKTLELLLVSKVRIKTLEYFALNPNKPIHLRGAVRLFEEEINAVRREVSRLEEIKLLIGEDKGNRRYYRLNMDHPFVPELISIFHKTAGLGGAIVNNAKRLGNVEFVVLTPYFTSGQMVNMQVIDLVVIGDIDLQLLGEIVKKEEYANNREIHYMVMKSSEFQIRKRRREQMMMDLLMQNNVLVLGNYDDFYKI